MKSVTVIVFLLSFLSLLLGCIGFLWPKLFKNRKTGVSPKRIEVLVQGMVVGVLLFALFVYLIPKEDIKTDLPSNAVEEQKIEEQNKENSRGYDDIKKLDSSLTSVEETVRVNKENDDLVPMLVLSLNERGLGSFPAVLSTIERVLKGLESASLGNEYEFIRFVVYEPTIDHLGNKGYSRAMGLDYDWKEMKSVKWENLPALARAERVYSVVAQRPDMINRWCAKDANMQRVPAFCRRAH